MQRHMMLAGLQLDCSNLELLWPSTWGMHNARAREWESSGRLRVAYGKRFSEESRDAFFQYYHFVFHAGLQRLALQQLEGLFDGRMRQAKCSVVHGHHPAGIQIEKGASGVGGTCVDIAKLGRIVGAARQQR